MKITDIRAIYPNYPQTLGGWRPHLWQIVVRVETDVGIAGFGYGGGGQASLPIINGHFRELVIGRSIERIDDIAKIWDDLYFASVPYGRKGIAMMALSGLDLALWDLLGKAEKRPVYRLIEQIQNRELQQEKIRAYASGLDSGWYAELGYTAHKLPHRWESPADTDKAIQMAEHARNALGPNALLMFDCYLSWDENVTRDMANQLADFNIYWFEDVTTPDQLAAQSSLRETIKPILLAGGEHEFTHHGFADIARTNALDIWQPDVTWCGGITATLRIIEQAQAANAQVVLHRGGEVWGLHVIAATACDKLAELLPGKRDSQLEPLWIGEPKPVNGYLSLSDEPGFGVHLNETMVGSAI